MACGKSRMGPEHFSLGKAIQAIATGGGVILSDAIAETYWHVATQPKSAWTWEVELRPWVERF